MRHIHFSLLALITAFLLPQHTTAQSVMPQLGEKITTDDGIYVVSGQNLITNPSFDDGYTGWLASDGNEPTESNFTLEASGGADGGAYIHALSSAGSSSSKSLLTGWPVEIGKTYVFSVWANRPSTDGNMQWSLILNSEALSSRDKQLGTVHYEANKWVQTEIVFTAEHPFLVANFAWLNQASFDAFYLGEVTLSDELATTALEAAIADGKYQLENTVEGNERGQYSTEVRATLQTAISTAEGVLASATTQAQINETTTTLKAAIATYLASANAPFKVGTKYNIVHNSGYLMTTTGGTVKVVSEDADDKGQVFTFVPAPSDAAAAGFNLQSDDGTFVHRSGSWDTKADASYDLTQANAIFQIVDQGSYLQLKNMGSNSVLGTDSNNDGSTVYSNKNGTDGKNRWTLKEFIPKDQRDDEYNFRLLLAKAEKALSEINESTVGSELFMTSRSAYDTYAAAVATAQATTSGYKAATETLQAAMDAFTENRYIMPDPSTKFVITQRAAGNRLSYTEGLALATVSTPSADATQQFTFAQVAATGNFSLKNVGAALFLAKSGSSNWDTNWANDDCDLLAQWLIELHSDGTYTLQNASGKGYLGSDATSDGSLLYCDKSSSATNSRWYIEKYTPTAALEKTIAQAKELTASTPVGSAYYEVPQSAMDALNNAIATAEAALKTITTFEEGAEATEKLNAAIATFNTSFNPMQGFDEGVTYTITHYGGSLLTATESGNASITTMPEEGATESQLVTFEPVEGTTLNYYIKSVAMDTYLARTGDYNTLWQTEKDEAAQVEIVHLDGKWLGLRFVSNGKHAGTDSSASGQLVYSDKSGKGNSLAYWFIDSYVTVILDRVAFNAALEAANTLLSEMKPGYLIGEYFEEDIAAFRQIVNTARSSASKAKDQETLDGITAQLKTDTETARSKAHTKDYMNHSQLAAAIQQATTAITNAVAGDCNGQYPASAIEAYKQVLSTATTVNEKPDDQLTQAEIDAATADLKAAAETFKAARVTINLTELKVAIAEAQKVQTDAQSEKGTGPGKYPENAFAALQTAINDAQTIVSENKVNQVAVDGQTATLTTAIATFKASRIPNDYTELQALVDEATQLIADVEAGKISCSPEDLEELKSSLDKNAAALESTNQDEIDRAAKLLRRDISLFSSIIAAINDIATAGNLNGEWYDLNGRHLSRPIKGMNILRMSYEDEIIIRSVMIK